MIPWPMYDEMRLAPRTVACPVVRSLTDWYNVLLFRALVNYVCQCSIPSIGLIVLSDQEKK